MSNNQEQETIVSKEWIDAAVEKTFKEMEKQNKLPWYLKILVWIWTFINICIAIAFAQFGVIYLVIKHYAEKSVKKEMENNNE